MLMSTSARSSKNFSRVFWIWIWVSSFQVPEAGEGRSFVGGVGGVGEAVYKLIWRENCMFS